MNKNKSNTKRLILKERISITALFMAVLAFFVVLVGILVPYSQQGYVARTAYKRLDTVIVNAINATYGFGSSYNVNPYHDEMVFVVIDDIDGKYYYPTIQENPMIPALLERLAKEEPDSSGRKNVFENDFYLSVISDDYAELNLEIETSSQIVTRPIDIPDEAIIYAGINRHSILVGTRQFAFYLGMILFVGYLILIFVVFLISNRIMKPTRDALKHEKNFVANASHELKTPLAIITSSAELLRDKNPDNTDYVNNIISQCANMNETIIDMIELSKLETSTNQLEKVDLSQLILNLCLSFDAVAFEKEIKYSYDIQPNIILDAADKKNLIRLVNLLIDNAMKYTQDQKIIAVSLKKDREGIVLRVYNTGCQIPDEERDKVFQRFYQGKAGADIERKGSGLGLAIVKQICENYNYSVEIDSHYQRDMAFVIVFK